MYARAVSTCIHSLGKRGETLRWSWKSTRLTWCSFCAAVAVRLRPASVAASGCNCKTLQLSMPTAAGRLSSSPNGRRGKTALAKWFLPKCARSLCSACLATSMRWSQTCAQLLLGLPFGGVLDASANAETAMVASALWCLWCLRYSERNPGACVPSWKIKAAVIG